ncbi:hypothetical protein QG37_04078 [Candidozyma auris]|uniref:Uncharacterized protein n=1 Tax=Candidozyma auris TaxID=498019 RepID=A0A0L0NXW3_CANAR|nr:hypothetical protein QG37_04078 [[Candida] auris]
MICISRVGVDKTGRKDEMGKQKGKDQMVRTRKKESRGKVEEHRESRKSTDKVEREQRERKRVEREREQTK